MKGIACSALTKTSPPKEYTLNRPFSAPLRNIQARLIQPALGPANKIHATAPRYDGITNVPRSPARMSVLPGIIVLAKPQASGRASNVATNRRGGPQTGDLNRT